MYLICLICLVLFVYCVDEKEVLLVLLVLLGRRRLSSVLRGKGEARMVQRRREGMT